MLSEGFGKAEPAPVDEDEKLRAAFEAMCEELSNEKLLEVAAMPEHQRRLLARPLVEQMALADADDDEVEAIAQRHGYSEALRG